MTEKKVYKNRIVGYIERTTLVKIKALFLPIFGAESVYEPDDWDDLIFETKDFYIDIYEDCGPNSASNYLVGGFFYIDLSAAQEMANRMMNTLDTENIRYEIDVYKEERNYG
jgi:hypothetical protein